MLCWRTSILCRCRENPEKLPSWGQLSQPAVGGIQVGWKRPGKTEKKFLIGVKAGGSSQEALVVKNPRANVRDKRVVGLIPGSGRSPEKEIAPPTPVFLPGEFHGQRRLVDYSPWGHRVRHG